ncbi:MAG TPA: DnaA regulatory inactivator Hda [Steroidobacteraceae bacterium]|nr:DnaA regulatory inactivator Hda [Steroidobacteraceae bacterium]
MRQLPLSVRPHDRALFESFHAGPNAAVVAQLLTLAEHAPPGLTWLYGPAGSGKTHLLQAICARAGATALYLPLSQVSSLGAAALREWQGARYLCVDELAMAVGQIEWERELFALYRDCEERGASLVMAAREVPAQLPFALPDLASRCAAGQRLGLYALEESEQCLALRLRARQRGFELPEESALYLQRRLPRDMSSLFALLDELDTAALAAQRRLTVPFIRDALARRRA